MNKIREILNKLALLKGYNSDDDRQEKIDNALKDILSTILLTCDELEKLIFKYHESYHGYSGIKGKIQDMAFRIHEAQKEKLE